LHYGVCSFHHLLHARRHFALLELPTGAGFCFCVRFAIIYLSPARESRIVRIRLSL
jgi:hypothetical protein